MRNYLSRLFNNDAIADAYVFPGDFVRIVEADSGNFRAGDLNGLEFRYRGQCAGFSDLYVDVLNPGA
jgi:hypothetical protein